jgi:hypothetical protein
MNKALITKWAQELRNPANKQARFKLKTIDEVTGEISYCCLGVLGEKVCGENLGTNVYTDIISFEGGNIASVPARVSKALGVKTGDVRIFGRHAASLNDSLKLTFDEIADLLEIAVMEGEGVE